MSTASTPACQRRLASAMRPGFGSLWQIVEEIDELRAEQMRLLADSNTWSRMLIETALTVLEQKRGDCLEAIGSLIGELKAAITFIVDDVAEDVDGAREQSDAYKSELSDLILGVF